MKAAKKDDSGIFDSVLVHFGSDKARFHPQHLKIDRSFITVPSAWQFKPLTEVEVKLQLPPHKKGRGRSLQCRGIIVDCRPLVHKNNGSQKGSYHIDLFLTHIPIRDASHLRKIAPAFTSSAA